MNNTTLLSPDATDRIWRFWLQNVECADEREQQQRLRYTDYHRRGRFNSWLWDQGGSLCTVNKQFHVKAYGSDATFLVMRFTQ